MKHKFEFTIIGGGINGLMVAKELLLYSNNIAVIEKSQIGREASWAGGGILMPLYPWRQKSAISELVKLSINQYPILAQQLKDQTGIDPEWYDCGLLISKNPDLNMALDWCHTYQIRHQQVDAYFPEFLHCQPENSLWLPDIAQARNPRLLKSLKAFLEQNGVKFFQQHEVTDLRLQGHRVEQVCTTFDEFITDQLVVTAGAWSGVLLQKLLPGFQQMIDIMPVKGQMLLFAAEQGTLPFMILDEDRYLIPRRDGHIIAGSTVEQSEFKKFTTDQAKRELFQFATDLLPPLKDYNVVAHWAGLRPGSPDGVPVISQHCAIDNIYINAGHFRNGLTMAPASAQLLVDLICDRSPCVDPSPYQMLP